jgi:outer membrane translocation and assembly module TamA
MKLKEFIELDEGFFETSDRSEKDNKKGNQGRGSNRQAKVLVGVETQARTQQEAGAKKNKHKPERKVKYLKMKVMYSLDAKSINDEISETVHKNSKVKTDGYKGYSRLREVIKSHEMVVVKDKTQISKVFPWVHTCISNAKRLLLGIHHSIKSIYAQNYLDKFCYKFNRRYFGENLFERLLFAAAGAIWHSNSYKSG